ncbi:MAG TPA: hypothetical protein VHE30_02035 [Polyangiaceae bacterium]|nr:hypothetical protein [Polyangiaceae bacterium]
MGTGRPITVRVGRALLVALPFVALNALAGPVLPKISDPKKPPAAPPKPPATPPPPATTTKPPAPPTVPVATTPAATNAPPGTPPAAAGTTTAAPTATTPPTAAPTATTPPAAGAGGAAATGTTAGTGGTAAAAPAGTGGAATTAAPAPAATLSNFDPSRLAKLDDRLDALRKRVEERTATRAARKQAQQDRDRIRWGSLVDQPKVRAELDLHAMRVARLERIQELSQVELKPADAARASKALDKENVRHEKAMTALAAGGGK